MARLDHVGIYVRDLEKSLNFYREIFGFPEHHRLDTAESRIVFLHVGGGLLELIQRPGAPGIAPGGRWSHVSFQIDNYDGLVSRLERMGLDLRKVTLDDGSRVAFFKDPDGHDVEIMEKGQFQ